MNPKRLAGLWGIAVATVGATAVQIAAPAFAAAPSIDTVVPTANYQVPCASGLSAATLCRTDNASVSYYMDSSGEFELEAVDRSAVEAAIARYDSNTDLTVTYDSSPTFSGSGETD